ncbi:hypothetical protein DUI87_12996 [Hirundo rustica rustica]|uniref:Uncharacterized protein n=1 Tax=Hirundo rustica rustica TaxID=333673 RepID=A0A3M0KAU1_HIRRU|nr:hypothetical protein DUI87_12996 [Hirundo rustica rustica]
MEELLTQQRGTVRLNKQQLQVLKERFQAFLNGETQIVADEAFCNAVRSYYEEIVKRCSSASVLGDPYGPRCAYDLISLDIFVLPDTLRTDAKVAVEVLTILQGQHCPVESCNWVLGTYEHHITFSVSPQLECQHAGSQPGM